MPSREATGSASRWAWFNERPNHFDDAELFEKLDAAAIEWLDGRTCRVELSPELAAWIVKHSKYMFTPDELEFYVENLSSMSGSTQPITIHAGWRSIEDGAHRLHAVCAAGRGYEAIIRIKG